MLNRLERMSTGAAKYEEPVTSFLAFAASFIGEGVIAATTTAGGLAATAAVGGIYQGRQAAQAQKKQAALQKRQADLRNQRQRRQAVRAARIRRAEVVAGGEAAGVDQTSSAVAGGAGSVTSQLGANLSFLDQSQNIQQSIFAAGSAAASAGASQAAFATVGGIASKFVDYKSIFK